MLVMVLNDGETYSALEGCKIVEIPDHIAWYVEKHIARAEAVYQFDAEAVEEYLTEVAPTTDALYSRAELQQELADRIFIKTGYCIPTEQVELGFLEGFAEAHAADGEETGRGVPLPVFRDHATAGPDQEAPEPSVSERESRTDYVLTVCLDGVPEGRDYDAIEETIEATGQAMCRYEEAPEKIVTLLLSEQNQDYRAGTVPTNMAEASK